MENRLLTLAPRLQMISDMVTGRRIADIGTDHGYLPIYLLQNRRIDFAIASDIGREPLAHAVRSAEEYGVTQGIDFRLCAGLDAVAPQEVDTIIIAGMGGETIAQILDAAPWTREGAHMLLLQPMTKQPLLRRWLWEHEYTVTREQLVLDKGTIYPIIEAHAGTMSEPTAAQCYGGIRLGDDPLFGVYAGELIKKLRRAAAGRAQAKDAQAAGEDFTAIADALEKMKGEGENADRKRD